MIGSSSLPGPSSQAFTQAAWAAISNAISDESTSWKAPSISVTLKSITGKPASGPESITAS